MTRQLHPIEINTKTGEPFLRLPAPHQNIILTPPRQGDQSVLTQHMNDPAIYGWKASPPVPYLPEHADFKIQSVKEESDATLEYLRKSEEEFPNGPLQFVDVCPVRHLREVKENGEDILIGDVAFKRSPFDEVLDEVERKRLREDNANKQAGDPTIQYAFGDWLATSHHGRGIMTAAVGLLMSAWAIPRMGARHVVAHTFAGNIGSNRVFEKNGFVNRGLFDNGKTVRGERKSDISICSRVYCVQYDFHRAGVSCCPQHHTQVVADPVHISSQILMPTCSHFRPQSRAGIPVH